MDSLIQIVSITVGALLVVYQLGRQHRNEIKLQQDNFRQEQRLKLFEQIAELEETAQTAIAELSTMGLSAPNQFDLFKIVFDAHSAHPKDVPIPGPIRTRGNDFVEAFKKASAAVSAVTMAVERREILNPDFSIFRIAIIHQSQKCLEAYMAFSVKIAPYLSISTPDGLRSSPLMPPSAEDDTEIKILGQKFYDEYFTLQMYLSDLIIEAQNSLLGQLFQNRLPIRQPLDPKHLVISTEIDAMKIVEERLELAKHFPPEKLPSRLAELRRPQKQCHWIPFANCTCDFSHAELEKKKTTKEKTL